MLTSFSFATFVRSDASHVVFKFMYSILYEIYIICVPHISIDTANVISWSATVTVHYGAYFEAVGTHSISSATCKISVLAQLVKSFLNRKQKAWVQRRTRLSKILKDVWPSSAKI